MEHAYAPLVRENTKFWNVSGAKIEGGIFSGLSITAGSLQSIIKGGIALATPNTEETGPVAQDGYHFILHDDAEKDWIDWNPDIILLDQDKRASGVFNLNKQSSFSITVESKNGQVLVAVGNGLSVENIRVFAQAGEIAREDIILEQIDT